MSVAQWPITPADLAFFAKELDAFLPHRIFDAHCHLYRNADFTGATPSLAASGPAVVDWPCFLAHMQGIAPGREYSGLVFPFPAVGLDTASANQFLADQLAAHSNLRGAMIVTPDMDPEFIRQTVRRHRFSGLKCYHVFARTEPTFDSAVEAYLPEEQVRIAHEERLSITLHMVRARAIADPVNQESIARLARKYPDARWILAHAARGFNPYHTIEGIGALKGAGNIWCDTSAVTEAGAFEAIVRTLGADRLLYGADFPVTHLRGRCVAIGDSFLWLTAGNTKFHASYAPIEPLLIFLESLRALKTACWNLQLNDTAVEAIFHTNAARLFP
ncbi:MAG: amidohydrolase family protein [Bryobacterales bacterium]|nr:amidohydrolase family protein [Bryobacterales bacterium]